MKITYKLTDIKSATERFWQAIDTKKVIAFHGNMGAGKTTFIHALCETKGVKDVVGSPTFSIINEYCFTDNEGEKKIYHLDLYRLNSMEEIIQAGVEDCIYSGEICFVEWPEKAPEFLNENTVHVYIDIMNSNIREVKIETTPTSYIV